MPLVVHLPTEVNTRGGPWEEVFHEIPTAIDWITINTIESFMEIFITHFYSKESVSHVHMKMIFKKKSHDYFYFLQ